MPNHPAEMAMMRRRFPGGLRFAERSVLYGRTSTISISIPDKELGMISRQTSAVLGCLGPLFLAANGLDAQAPRVTLPEGSVIIVRTTTPLESSTAQTGQTFETTVADNIGADDYTVIPTGSRIRGVVTFARPADRQQSGVIEVNFDRLTLPDGSVRALSGKLTSTDAAERRQ